MVRLTLTLFLTILPAAAQNLFTAAPGGSFAAGSRPHAVATGDFNGDGIGDVAAVNPYTNQVTILYGTPSGSLVTPDMLPVSASTTAPSSILKTGALPSGIAAGYFNIANSNSALSSSLDIVVANLTDGNVYMFANNGSGVFAQGQIVAGVTVHSPTAIVTGDFNQDGNPDIAVASGTDNKVYFYMGNGSLPFSASSTLTCAVGSHPIAMAFGNFGGVPGVAVANEGGGASPANGGTVTVCSFGADSSGNPTVNASSNYSVLPGILNPPQAYPSSIAVADFNNDGYPDIVTTNVGTNDVSLLLGNALGGFTAATSSPLITATGPIAAVAGDFNGDTFQDIAVANYNSGTVTVLLGQGNGTFTKATGSPYATGASPIALGVGDFNGTGKPALAIANQGDNSVAVLLNSGGAGISVVSAASLALSIAPGSIISIMGSNLASAAATPPYSALPFTLGGTSVSITYSNGAEDVLPLYFVSPNQVNAEIPAGPSLPPQSAVTPVPGLATITVVSNAKTQSASVMISPLAPALFSANGNGNGVAAATFTNPFFQTTNVFQCSGAVTTPPGSNSTPAPCVPVPLDLSAGGTLTLNATGLGNATQPVTVTVGGQSYSVTPSASTISPGLYQLVVQLKANPSTRGVVPVMVTTAQGMASNVVTVLIQ